MTITNNGDITMLNNTGDDLSKDNSFLNSKWGYFTKGFGSVVVVATGLLVCLGIHKVLKCMMPNRYFNTEAGLDQLAEAPLQPINGGVINGDIPTNQNNDINVLLMAENAL